MPRLSRPAQPATKIEFVLSIPLDLVNALYFTGIAEGTEGIEGWPAKIRREMAADLREEMDFLFTFPKGQAGIMGQFCDHLWAHPEAWTDVDALLRYLNNMPAGIGDPPSNPGIQGLVFYSCCQYQFVTEPDVTAGRSYRDTLRAELEATGIAPEPALQAFDEPKQLRARMASLVQRFYDEHYKDDLHRRLPLLERSYEAHRRETDADPVELTKKLTDRSTTCIGSVCIGPYERLYFAPSLDMGPYVSCADLGSVHGLFYPCDEGIGDAGPAGDIVRLARVYKALGDEQRLAILRMLRGREMFVQEIVERTGLHQSVVSRHLSFMAAVGLLTKRREGSMKYVSMNPEIKDTLSQTLDLFEASATAES